MSRLASLLPRLAVFAVAAVLSGIVATVAVAAVQDRAPVSTAGQAPSYLLTQDTPGNNTPAVTVAFNEQPSGAAPSPLPTLSPRDLQAVSTALLGTKPVKRANPTGFPRVTPVTQFDRGPLQGVNCTMASGAMLARLGFGIVTNGSTLRAAQPDQQGGTSLWDLSNALWGAYGVRMPLGFIHTAKLKALLGAGYGAVIQGMYADIPVQLRLQKDFTGGHSIYVDGYYPGDPKTHTPEAYYVIDPLGHPWAGYQGAWWPASIVDRFMHALSGGDLVAAMWAYPPGGTPPDVVGPDVLPIPADSGPGASTPPDATPAPSGSEASTSPTESASASPTPTGSFVPPPPEPGDTVPLIPVSVLAAFEASMGGLEVMPAFDFCLVTPRPASCPTGIEATVTLIPLLIEPPPGPTATVLFADTSTTGVAMIGFTVDPATNADVRFWPAATGSSVAQTASSMATLPLLGQTVVVARLDVLADMDYQFQVVAGSGTAATTSAIGTFHSGPGLAQFDVSLGAASSPLIQLGTGVSPYLHPTDGAYAGPMALLSTLGTTACSRPVTLGGTPYCLDTVTLPAPVACTTAQVTYRIAGIDAAGVTIRAYPEGSGGALGTVIEVAGPAPSGTVSVGCLTSGLTYTVALETVGDDHGVLGSTTLAVP